MSVYINKKGLFTPGTVFPVQVKKRTLLERLERKVGDLAYKVLGAVALTWALCRTIGVATLGWSASNLLTITLYGVGGLCFYVRSCLRKYSDPTLFKSYQEEALKLCDRLQDLDQVDFLKGNPEKEHLYQHLLRPISRLITQHGSLETLMRYTILTPEEFKKAFDLEVKYLDLPQAFRLYAQIRQVITSAGMTPQSHEAFKGKLMTPEIEGEWVNKLERYLQDLNTKTIQANDPLAYDLLGSKLAALEQAARLIQGYFHVGILTQEGQRCEGMQQGRLKVQQQYHQLVHSHGKAIAKIHKSEELMKKLYAHRCRYSGIEQEQRAILVGLAEIHSNYHAEERRLRASYENTLQAIAGREHPLTQEDEEQRRFFQSKYDSDKAGLQKIFTERAEVYMNQGIADVWKERLESLKSYQESLRAEHRARIDVNSIETFKREHAVELQELENSCQELFKTCLEIVAHR